MSHNEPAFPRTAADPAWGNGTESFEGMTLRDYFAARALQYWLTLPITEQQLKIAATESYRVADAMLEARK